MQWAKDRFKGRNPRTMVDDNDIDAGRRVPTRASPPGSPPLSPEFKMRSYSDNDHSDEDSYGAGNYTATANQTRVRGSPQRSPGSPLGIPEPDLSMEEIRKLVKLREYDIVVLIDDSWSMEGRRWKETSTALRSLVRIITEIDSNGIDLHFLNSEKQLRNVKNPKTIIETFDQIIPIGLTPTGERLDSLLEAYMKSYREGIVNNELTKKVNFIVITDGAPTDPSRLEDAIVTCARELEALNAENRQIGIQFFQVGDDKEALYALEELDNALEEKYRIRDMVDTVNYRAIRNDGGLTGSGIVKVLLGAISDREDKKRY